MKYFLHADSMVLYSVPKRMEHLIEIINNSKYTDYEVNDAIKLITEKCNPKLFVDAVSQTL